MKHILWISRHQLTREQLDGLRTFCGGDFSLEQWENTVEDLAALREAVARAGVIALPLIERDDYGLRPFVREVAEDIAGRCIKCYEMRLFETARQAAEGGFDSFTSSLFISPYQNHELMREVAERAAHEYGVQFLYRDFRPYFRDGQTFAREHDFYIQKYCGCVFSEQERYLKPKKIIP